jgi:hypothetical protein
MTTKGVLEVPPGMQRIHRRFERWRSSHQGRLPIPEALWASAAAAGMLRLCRKRKRGATAGKRSTVSRLLS